MIRMTEASSSSSSSSSLDRHYDTVASDYQKAWFYEDGTEYQGWLAREMAVRAMNGCDGRVWGDRGGIQSYGGVCGDKTMVAAAMMIDVCPHSDPPPRKYKNRSD